MKFIIIVCATFFARVKPVSTSANPACMNMTRKPVNSVHMMLIETRLWPAKSATSSRVGLPAVFAVTSLIPPVAVPAGSGFDGGGAGAAAGAAGAAGTAGLSWANTQPPTASRQATTRAAAILHGHVRTIDPRSFTVIPPEGRAPRVAQKKNSAHLRAPLPASDVVVARRRQAARRVPRHRNQQQRQLSDSSSYDRCPANKHLGGFAHAPGRVHPRPLSQYSL